MTIESDGASQHVGPFPDQATAEIHGIDQARQQGVRKLFVVVPDE